MRLARPVLIVLALLVGSAACRTPGGGAPADGAHVLKGGDEPGVDAPYEALRVIGLAPSKDCRDFAAATGITVTRRVGGRAVEGKIRVLGDHPSLDVHAIGAWNAWGAEKTEADRLLPVPGTPYYEGSLRALAHGMEYRLLVDGEQRLDPAALVYTPKGSPYLNSVFWDFEQPGAYRMRTRSVDLRGKPVMIAEAEVLELARKWPRGGAVGPASVAETYRFVAESGLVAELKRAGYNAVEFLPFNASVDGDSWRFRYQVYGLFAPEARYGTPDDFARMIDAFNAAGIAVIMDAVVGHYPYEANEGVRALAPVGLHRWKKADGGLLFGQVASPWGTYRYDYANPYVRRFLTDSVVHMLCRYGISGIRFDNLDGIRLYEGAGGGGPQFLKGLMTEVRAYRPEGVMIGEMFFGHVPVLRSLAHGGYGIDYRTHSDLFDFFKDNLQKQTAEIDLGRLRGAVRGPWEWGEAPRVQYLTNHDEAANRRDGATGAYVATLLAGGGSYYVEKKTTAFGSVAMLSGAAYLDMPQMRLLQEGDFNDNAAVDWGLLARPETKRVYDYFAELSRVIVQSEAFAFPSLHADVENHVDDGAGRRVVSFERRSAGETWLAVINLGHVAVQNYGVGTNAPGAWKLVLTSDAERFGGTGELESRLPGGRLVADGPALHGKQSSLSLPYLAPYATVLIRRE